MIRKILIIAVLFLISQNAGSQVIRENLDFKILNKDFKRYISNITPLSSPNAIIANPNSSKYPVSNFITDIFPFGDTTWFSTGSGIMRTLNRLQSFQNYFGVQPFGDDDVSGFIIKDNVVVVATAITQEISGESVAVGTGIKVSTDKGISWNSYGQPIDAQSDTNIVYGSNVLYSLPVVVPQQNLSYDIAVTKTKNDLSNYTIWISSFAGGLRKSTDYGQSWLRVLLPPDELDSIYVTATGYNFSLDPRRNLNHRAFTVEAVNDSVIMVGTADGINISRDWGINWRKYNYQNSGTGTGRVGGNFVVNFHIQRFQNSTILWAATRKAEDINEVSSLSYSSNFGYNWNYTLTNISPNGVGSFSNIVYGLTDDGLYRADYGIFDWSKAPLIYDEVTKDAVRSTKFYSAGNLSDTVLIGSADGLIRFTESGIGWPSKWKIFRAIETIDLSSDVKTYAAPNPFSPPGEVTRIFYKTGKNLSKITIKIFDFGMNPVRTVIQNATRTSPDELFTSWDGANDKGAIVSNGVYFYRIEVDDDKPVWGKILLLR